MTKKYIVIHAGFHKTGTTALQVKLSENQQELENLGIVYPEIDRGDNVDKRSGYSGNEIFIDQQLRHGSDLYFLRNADKHVILSAENLCHFRNGLKLIWLVNFLKNLGTHDVVVVFTYKASSDMAISHYREFCKNNDNPYGYFWFFVLRSIHLLVLIHFLKIVSRVSYIDTSNGAIGAFSSYLTRELPLEAMLDLQEEHIYHHKQEVAPVKITLGRYGLLKFVVCYIFVPLNKKIDFMTCGRIYTEYLDKSLQFSGKNASLFKVNLLFLKDLAKSLYRSVKYICLLK